MQTKIAHYVTDTLNEDFKTDISVDQVAISVFGGVKLKKVLIRDHHKDTLIYANRLKTNILNFRKLTNGDLHFGDIRADSLKFYLKNYKGEHESNINVFVKLFENDKPKSKKPFELQATNIYLTSGHFRVINEDAHTPKSVDFTKMNATLHNFKIKGSEINSDIEKLSFQDHRGIFVENLKTTMYYSNEKIVLKDLDATTSNSLLKGNITMKYKVGGMADFINKVDLDIKLDTASVATNDLNFFYNEFGKNKKFALKTHAKGTLNNLYTHNLHLIDERGSEIKGDIHFKNLLNPDKNLFYIGGKFEKVNSNYKDLIGILPNVLGNKLPSSFQKLGQFNLSGLAEITKTSIDANLKMVTQLGNLSAEMVMTNINNIDNATYKGKVILDNFDAGKMLNQNGLGKVTLNLDVDGKGFTEKYLNTAVVGTVKSVYYNKYNYRNITVNGHMKMPIYEGRIDVNDPNLLLSFNGLIDLSKKEKRYDFHATVDYADLHELNFIKKDSIAIFKGDLDLKAEGNTLENVAGKLTIAQTSYQNNKDTYFFEDFTIESLFDADRIRTITIDSPDIIEGQLVGKYRFKEVQKLVENALGSLYANYSPNKVEPNQFMKFNFTIYNKIIEIFYPEIKVGTNTAVSGTINSDAGEFKFNFNSPNIVAFENYFNNIQIKVDNKNPLFDAYIEMDSVRTKYYKISEFSSINIKSNDTLFVRTEFKGGNENKDYYNLNLYHTIDKDNKSVVGFKKSEVNFKNYLWFLNEKDTGDNKIVFNKKLTDFSIDKIIMSHENQNIELMGVLRDSTYKDISLNFNDVDLSKVVPTIDSLKVDGVLRGMINFKQDKNVYQPTSSLRVQDLKLNKTELGNLMVDVTGDESLRRFNISSTLEKNDDETFSAKGGLQIINKETNLDLDVKMDKLDLSAFSSFGGSVISNIRGYASGRANIQGPVKNLEVDGRLYLQKTGMTIPYLNVDYEFDKDVVVDLTESEISLRRMRMTDTKMGTSGILDGVIRHKHFTNWILDLNIQSDRLLVLDSKDSDDAIYYGTAIIKGGATIKGPTKGLLIEVEATSLKGTAIKIPVNSARAVGSTPYIHFISPKEKYNKDKNAIASEINNSGLELKFNLDITPEAEIEIIIDKNTGHGIKGQGFGTILLDINTLGKFNMWGNFIANKGYYNFKYGGIIDKRFEVKNGGSINWEGDPTRAIINIEAIYKTQANPAVLLDNLSFNRKIPVEVSIKLTDQLMQPTLDFAINFPNVSSVLKSEIQYKLDDRDTRQTQALYLLASGSFLSNTDSGENAVTGSLLERASGIFSDIFADQDGKFNVGVDYQQADRNPNAVTDGRVGLNISTQINEDITINGKLGVPVGGATETVIVGNVEVLLRLNEDRTLNARVFNRENDINYFGENIGYTQGVGLSWEMSFDTFREFLTKIFNSEKLKQQKGSATEIPDSDFSPEYIKFIEKRDKKKNVKKPKHQVERVPEVD